MNPYQVHPYKILQHLHPSVKDCTACNLNQPRGSNGLPTCGVGQLNPRVALFGEAPGAEEQRTGRPFVGRSGALLQQQLQELGLALEDIYVTNVVKHRPPNNADPTSEQLHACQRWLTMEMDIVRPKAIVCLGRVATKSLFTLNGQELPKGSYRGLEFSFYGIKAISSWHPAYLLRNPHKPELREQLKNDILRAMENT